MDSTLLLRRIAEINFHGDGVADLGCRLVIPADEVTLKVPGFGVWMEEEREGEEKREREREERRGRGGGYDIRKKEVSSYC